MACDLYVVRFIQAEEDAIAATSNAAIANRDPGYALDLAPDLNALATGPGQDQGVPAIQFQIAGLDPQGGPIDTGRIETGRLTDQDGMVASAILRGARRGPGPGGEEEGKERTDE